MTTALVVEHVEQEGAGHLGMWLPEAGLRLERCRLWAGDQLPTRPSHDALIVMGGPMAAYRQDATQAAEIALIKSALDDGVPLLGICLGAQLLALAAGGQVAPHPAGPEFGVGLVRRADAAAEDPVFRTVPFLPDVVHWHHDHVSVLPPGAVPLARGEHTEHQAFRVGTSAWGLQFHIEVDEATVARWAADDGVDPSAVVPFGADVDLARTWRAAMAGFARVAQGLFTGTTLSS
ncbi:MAG TPA: type 1 glutamine amidotransferase [Mycobacteriales bacterium]|jgi:GMP synthase-like glutamine amidotransferase|nr:type 1 glutamine amidotransferase [Mycobacteriales bacterium]